MDETQAHEFMVEKLDRLMQCKKYKILLFIDNSACYQRLLLKTFATHFSLPNVPTMLQSLDQGLTKDFKQKHHKLILSHLISNIKKPQHSKIWYKKQMFFRQWLDWWIIVGCHQKYCCYCFRKAYVCKNPIHDKPTEAVHHV